MAHNVSHTSKKKERAYLLGLERLPEQLRRLQQEGLNLANRVRDDAVAALSDGQRAVESIVEQATRLGDGLQARIQGTGRDVERQIERMLSGIESEISRRTDGILNRLSQTVRREQERIRDRVRAVETRVTEVARWGGIDGIEELRAGIGWARSNIEQVMTTVRQTTDALDSVRLRVQQLERRIAGVAKESARELIDADEFRHKLSRVENRVSDLGRDVASKHGEQSALRERLTRLETRFVNSTKEDAARAAANATVKERQVRIEARLSDLTKELLARAMDLSTIRERLARAEAHLAGLQQTTDPGLSEAVAGNR